VDTNSGGTITSIATNNGLSGGTITTFRHSGLDLTKIGGITTALSFWNGSQLQATGTPSLTIGYLIGTSTTATSTFAAGVQRPT